MSRTYPGASGHKIELGPVNPAGEFERIGIVIQTPDLADGRRSFRPYQREKSCIYKFLKIRFEFLVRPELRPERNLPSSFFGD